MLWWVVLVLSVGRMRHRIEPSTISWLNRVGGLAIGGFGLVMLLLGLTHQ